MSKSSWFARGGVTLALLAVLAVGLTRPAPAAPRSGFRGAVTNGRPLAVQAAAAASTGGSGEIVVWGYATPPPAGLSDVVSVDGGYMFSAALRSEGTVVTWGPDAPAVPAGLSGVKAISASESHVLALKSDGKLVAWGNDVDGQLDVPAGLSDVQAIAIGPTHSMALRSNGTVALWGMGSGATYHVPSDLTRIAAIDAGKDHSLVLKSDGTVAAWGFDSYGQTDVPDGLQGVVAIAAGYYHNLALLNNGTVVSWGKYFTKNGVETIPVPAGLTGVVAISSYDHHDVALKSDGTVVAWGADVLGSTQVPALTGVTAISTGEFQGLAIRGTSRVQGWGSAAVPAGLPAIKALTVYGHFLALRGDGTVAAWGANDYGQATVPADLAGVTAVTAGIFHSLALKSDGTVAAWGIRSGINYYGQTAVPAGLNGVTAIATGTDHNLALKSDGTVVAWGEGHDGQTTVPDGLRDVTAISAGAYHSLALKSNGTVVGWGQTTVPPGLTDIVAISAGYSFDLALKSNGTVVRWGDNTYHQLDVPGDLGVVKAISAGAIHALAVRSDGTVAAWGNNGQGQLNVPAGLSEVSAVAAGFHLSAALVANHAPTLTPPAGLATREDVASGTVSFTVADDGGAGGVTVTAASDVPGLVQSFTLGGSGTTRTIRITPAANANGTATITLTASDGSAATTASFGLTVTPVNDAPSFTRGGDQTVNEDAGPQSVPGWAGSLQPGPTADEFTQNLTFQVTANSNPALFAAGPAVNGTTGELIYTPAANAHGQATLTLRLRDDGGTADGGQDTSATQTFTITVISVNDEPTALDQSVTTAEDTAGAITLGSVDLDGDALSYTVVASPMHGTLTGTGADRTYTPAANYHGTDSFTFYVRDGSVNSNTATVSLTITSVNDAPVAFGQSVTTAEDTAKSITLSGSDVDGDVLTYTLVTPPAHGTLSGTGADRTYIPAADYHGPDNFTFQVSDGAAASSQADVFLTITAVNDTPIATGQSATTAEDTAKALTLGASDIDGDSLSYCIVKSPAHGTLSGTGANRTYTPAANYYGPDCFTFKVNDGTVDSSAATVSLTVTSVNDLPVAAGESYTTPRGTLLEIAPAGVLGNDTDVDGDVLTAQLVTNVTGGALTLYAHGGFRYTPRIGFSGPDSFTYRPHDGTATGNTVTVTLQVSPNPPASTPDGQVEASGTIVVAGGNATFTLSAKKSGGRVMGSLTYTDPVRTRTLTSTELTAVVVTGRKARVFGKGKLLNGTLVDFVVDVEDVAEPGRGKDTLQLETSAVPVFGTVLSLGNIIVKP